jgi:uncharacterized Ntn-hydrolase superfamily protein
MRPGTYSIVARDAHTGDLGVAAQSHWFAIGAALPWAEAGVGAVATQSLPDPASGRKALDLLRGGLDPESVLERLHADDPGVAVRQVAIVDAAGRVATHTGAACVREAGHRIGDGFSCQASMMISPAVPDTMAAAFESASGTLDERLLAALEAAEAEGGDVRGSQAAVLLVAGERKVDLRVDDHPEPLAELRRLHGLHRAYARMETAEELAADGRHEESAPLMAEALALAPHSDELLFWAGLAAAEAGDLGTGLDRVRAAAALNPRWLALLDRLEPEVAPSAAEMRAALERHERSPSG